jgi:metal-dependent HD superfamily phosphatase/phosphodiesterase
MADTTEVIAQDRVAVPPDQLSVTKPANGRDGRDSRNGSGIKEAANAVQAAETALRPVTYRDVRNNEKVRAYIEKANEQMAVIGYSEHGLRHAALVAAIARNILLELGMEPRMTEIAAIAGFLHDIGNCVHRVYHPQIGATMAFQLLDQMGMDAREIGTVIGAVGNHEEPEGVAINAVTAAVIIADKSDVHFTRVQNPDPTTYDIHDRVNHAVQKSHIQIDREARIITLDLVINVLESSIMEYFEIFVARMIMCRKAATKLDCQFRLIINGTEL